MFGEIAPKMRGAGNQSLGALPAGTIIRWWQNDINVQVPPGWALCNGAVAVWETGPRAGHSFTTPNFIGMYSQGADTLAQQNSANPNGFGSPTPQTAVGATYGTTGGNNSYVEEGNTYIATYSAVNGHTHTYSIEPSAIVVPRLIKL
jgi:hypothetical protein